MQHRLGETSCSGRQLGSCDSDLSFARCGGHIPRTALKVTGRPNRWVTAATTTSRNLKRRHWMRVNATASLEVTTQKRATVTILPDADVSLPQSGQAHDDGQPSVRTFLKGRRIFVTGGTGFLAKVLLEKMLFEQPEVEQIYVLVQHKNGSSAEERLVNEVLCSQAFVRLQCQYGDRYSDFMLSKLTAIEGNMADAQMGLSQDKIAWLQKVVDVVVNAAACTEFDARFDTAVRVNTLGAQEVAEFARGCENLQVLLHVSTAFVNGLRRGCADESAFVMNHTVAQELLADGAPQFDVYDEIELALHLGDSVGAAAEESEAGRQGLEEALKAYGMNRANLFGWQDTYCFSKAMGEMLVQDLADQYKLPLAVIRPSIVESAYREPVRGWMEGVNLADPIILAYGKGQVDGFVGDSEGVLDIVPVDYVINAMLAAMTFVSAKRESKVFHVTTSVSNPLDMEEFMQRVSEYFQQNPMLDRAGQPIPVKKMEVYSTQHSLMFDLWRRYQLPLEIAEMKYHTSQAEDKGAAAALRKQKMIANKTYEQLSYLSQLYTPYTFYKCRFNCDNCMDLSGSLQYDEKDVFSFDPRDIDWGHYLREVHIPGLVKFVSKDST